METEMSAAVLNVFDGEAMLGPGNRESQADLNRLCNV